jgi:hypothetical protein
MLSDIEVIHRRTRSIAARVCSTVSGAIARSGTITVHPSSPTSRCAGKSFTRRAFARTGSVPFEADRPLARVTGLAAVIVRFFVVAMDPAYQPVRETCQTHFGPGGPAYFDAAKLVLRSLRAGHSPFRRPSFASSDRCVFR